MISKKLICLSIGLTILPYVLSYFMKKRFKKKIRDLHIKYTSPDKYYYQCIFISRDNIGCKQHIWKSISCGDRCSYNQLQTLIRFIRSARESISLCIYHFTLNQIAEAIIHARNRGVRVRIISDALTSKYDSSKVLFLDHRYNFETRTPSEKDDTTYMHHKFCLIDESIPVYAKMFFGSLNLTLQGICANFEFVVLTNNREMVKSFSDEFEMLWEKFKNS